MAAYIGCVLVDVCMSHLLEKFTENYLGDLRSSLSIMLHHDLCTLQTNPLVG